MENQTRVKRIVFTFLLALAFLLNIDAAYAQITSGKIIYERKTNLLKKVKSNNYLREWVEETERVKIDVFELLFNDSASQFKPQETQVMDEKWFLVAKNSVYQNLHSRTFNCLVPILGDEAYIKDTIVKRQWKITDSKRTIAGYICRKAIWSPNDTTRIYAWYNNEIAVSTGPEIFNGLPGAILGLATEDGSIIYFAKSVEVNKFDPKVLRAPKSKDKIYTMVEFKKKLDKDFGKEPWGKILINGIFVAW